MEVHIRPFEKTDQLAVTALYIEALRYYTVENSNSAIPSVLEHLMEARCGPEGDLYDIQNYYQTGDIRRNFFVAVDHSQNNRIVGSVGVVPSLEFDPDEYIELVRMSVDPLYHGSGVAGMLIATIESWAIQHQYRKINLTTLDGMIPAIKFYTKQGYRRCEEKETNLDLTRYGKSSGHEANSVKLVHFVKEL